MTEQKYRSNIVTALHLPGEITATRDPRLDESETIVRWLDGAVVPGASHMACIWYTAATPDQSYPAHTHGTDEVIGFFGSDTAHPDRLGGRIEFWIEDEQYFIEESCLIFVPAGVLHCPLVIHRVDAPIFHFTSLAGAQYVKLDEPRG